MLVEKQEYLLARWSGQSTQVGKLEDFNIRDRTNETKAYIKMDAIHDNGTKHIEKTVSEMVKITGFSASAIRRNTEDGSTYTRGPWSIVRQ